MIRNNNNLKFLEFKIFLFHLFGQPLAIGKESEWDGYFKDNQSIFVDFNLI